MNSILASVQAPATSPRSVSAQQLLLVASLVLVTSLPPAIARNGPMADDPAAPAPASSTSSPAAATPASPNDAPAAPPVVGPAKIEPAPEDVSESLAPIIEKHKIPAMAVAVIDRGRVVALGATGVRRRGDPTPVTTGDLWHLGSCTKSMTATLCAVLVDRGELAWEQTLATTFPFAAEGMADEFKAVTLEQLLTNRGGFPGEMREGGLWGKLWNFKGTGTEARRLTLETLTRKAPKTKPGAYEYSNASFSIAGLMAEQMTDSSWEELMQREVFAPLGITSAGFGAPGVAMESVGAVGTSGGASGKGPDQPRGHVLPLGVPKEPGADADNPDAIGPSGRVHMTIGDWAKYAAAHLDGEAMLRAVPANADKPANAGDARSSKPNAPAAGAPAPKAPRTISRPGELVSLEGWRKLHTAAPKIAEKDNEYAMGWGVTRRPWAKGTGPGDKGITLTHSGSNTMWFCVAWLAPERNFGVLVCVNQAGVGAKAADEAASAMIKRFADPQ
ncbi:MAG: beta-lactamase family protein [Phycisphaerales bacterium]|nr:beta-lactamase family protein [Phycisphaerales bacterium]